MFPASGFLVGQILGILESEIEIEKIFSLTNKLTNLRRCDRQLNNLEGLIFMSKNWPNDSRIDFKPPSNLVEMIQKDLDFEEFESSFEQDEIVDI
jgi:hypothetical protein